MAVYVAVRIRRWMQAVLILGLLTIAATSSVRAGEFKIDRVAIDVPAKFEGPISAQPDASAKTYAFTVRASNSLTPSSVLQITVYNGAADVQAGRSADISQRYLSQMLEGIERRRTDYQKSAPKEVRLAGFPGSVVSWQGKTNGIGTNGKMYCIVTPSGLLFFHVMGGGSMPNADMAAAIKAVENVRKY
ncbi:MAG: hypothetical protein ABIQ86_14255 [Steroidobacteraceae bacterium]